MPITDPTELEAIDRRRKENEKAMRAAEKAYDAALRKAQKRNARKRKGAAPKRKRGAACS